MSDNKKFDVFDKSGTPVGKIDSKGNFFPKNVSIPKGSDIYYRNGDPAGTIRTDSKFDYPLSNAKKWGASKGSESTLLSGFFATPLLLIAILFAIPLAGLGIVIALLVVGLFGGIAAGIPGAILAFVLIRHPWWLRYSLSFMFLILTCTSALFWTFEFHAFRDSKSKLESICNTSEIQVTKNQITIKKRDPIQLAGMQVEINDKSSVGIRKDWITNISFNTNSSVLKKVKITGLAIDVWRMDIYQTILFSINEPNGWARTSLYTCDNGKQWP